VSVCLALLANDTLYWYTDVGNYNKKPSCC